MKPVSYLILLSVELCYVYLSSASIVREKLELKYTLSFQVEEFTQMISCLISLLGCVVAALVFLNFLVKRFTWYNLARSMPGPRMYPIVGSLGLANSSQG